MPITADAVGRTSSITNEITPRWALAYSASLGLTDPVYLNDEQPTEFIVPPTFCVCLEWALAVPDRDALGLSPDERRMTVHILQDSRFHRRFELGMRVTTTSTAVYMRRTTAGTYVVTRFTHVDASSGEPLVTSFSGVMVRGIPIDRDIVGELPRELRERHENEITRHLAPLPLGRGLPHIYSECARIWNPIHTERVTASAAGLEDIIVHGTITWALAAREILSPMKMRLDRLARLSAQFRTPIVAGGSLRLSHSEINAGNAISFTAVNDRNEIALHRGELVLN